jgi:lipopolysaccharide export system protein LptC
MSLREKIINYMLDNLVFDECGEPQYTALAECAQIHFDSEDDVFFEIAVDVFDIALGV